MDSSVFGWGKISGCCEHAKEISGSIKNGQFLSINFNIIRRSSRFGLSEHLMGPCTSLCLSLSTWEQGNSHDQVHCWNTLLQNKYKIIVGTRCFNSGNQSLLQHIVTAMVTWHCHLKTMIFGHIAAVIFGTIVYFLSVVAFVTSE
jgi:hypothetical protein